MQVWKNDAIYLPSIWSSQSYLGNSTELSCTVDFGWVERSYYSTRSRRSSRLLQGKCPKISSHTARAKTHPNSFILWISAMQSLPMSKSTGASTTYPRIWVVSFQSIYHCHCHVPYCNHVTVSSPTLRRRAFHGIIPYNSGDLIPLSILQYDLDPSLAPVYSD